MHKKESKFSRYPLRMNSTVKQELEKRLEEEIEKTKGLEENQKGKLRIFFNNYMNEFSYDNAKKVYSCIKEINLTGIEVWHLCDFAENLTSYRDVALPNKFTTIPNTVNKNQDKSRAFFRQLAKTIKIHHTEAENIPPEISRVLISYM